MSRRGNTHSVDDNVPGQVPFEMFNVDENSLQLDDGQRRVGVVELNSYLFGELLPRTVGLLEAANDIIEGGCNPEVLLLQTKLLSTLQVIVGV